MNKQNDIPVCPVQEAKFPGICGKVYHCTMHIKPAYWLIVIIISLSVFLGFVPQSAWITLRNGIRAQKFLVAMIVIFGFLALSMVWSTGQRIDVWFFRTINKFAHHSQRFDWTMLAITQMGNGIFAYVIAFILFLRVQHLLAFELAFGILTLWMMVELMKVLIRRSRPYSKLTDTQIVGRREGGHSFPSGHTSQAFFMASLLAHYFHAAVWLPALLYTAALMVGVTRIYVGMHYPRDVLGGMILGTCWGLVGVFINSYIFSHLHLINFF